MGHNIVRLLVVCPGYKKQNELFVSIHFFYDANKKNMQKTAQLHTVGYTLPIIGLTCNIRDDHVKYFIKHGANEVLGKPTKKDKLSEILHKYLLIINIIIVLQKECIQLITY